VAECSIRPDLTRRTFLDFLRKIFWPRNFFVLAINLGAQLLRASNPRPKIAMGKIKKKGTAGQAKNYITRTQAVRKLQITLPDFRRLCIFKGIYPREPRNIKKASKSASHSTTFYYTKDIQYLLHEPLLAKFREQKALSKKIARSLGRNEVGDAARLEKYGTPKITLDHIIRERYPTFVDAIRDLDDALSLLFLFANLPSTTTVPAKVIARCQRQCHEFEHYLITTNSLRKSFLSIKGIYYQATIQGQDVMWLVPYRFVQRVTGDVDYRIMGTFVDFYATLLGFVNFRLYTSIGLVYPPKFDSVRDEHGAELAAFTLEGRKVGESLEDGDSTKALTNGHAQTGNSKEVQAQIDSITNLSEPDQDVNETEGNPEDHENSEAIDTFEASAPGADTLPQPEISGNEAAALFSDFTFFISREAPRHPIEFLLRAFGCNRIGWDAVLGEGAYTNNEADSRITHQIVDRAPLSSAEFPAITAGQEDGEGLITQTVMPGHYIPGRTYVQPQWVWDCINEGRLQRPDLYTPGATLPPHLSPWMKPTSGQYDPRAALAEQEREGEDDIADEDVEEGSEAENGEELKADASEEEEITVDGGMDVANSDDSDGKDIEAVVQNGEDDFAGFDDDEDVDHVSENEVEDERSAHQKELEAEAAGLPFTSTNGVAKNPTKEVAAKKRIAKQKQEDQELERQKMMMSRKKRKLYEKMQHSNSKKDSEAEALRRKRRKIEKSGAAGHRVAS
jgi:pescadillo